MVKPFEILELLVRIEKILARTGKERSLLTFKEPSTGQSPKRMLSTNPGKGLIIEGKKAKLMGRRFHMAMFLNSRIPYEAYGEIRQDKYFVDKTLLIGELIPSLGRRNRYFCITRPRRFGKTVMANMVGAFFGKSKERENLFDGLAIMETEDINRHLYQHEVIYIDFSRMPERCCSYEAYITRIIDGLKQDFLSEYPELEIDCLKSVWDILQKIFDRTNKKFIFVMDEWDAVFHMPFVSGQHKEYLLFLKNLLKDQVYAELVYMTGILPIAKYSDGSELNMFSEYNMAVTERFGGYFGFSDSEVHKLYEIYQQTTDNPKITREDLRIWYDGYHTASGERLYNPQSIVSALTDNQLRNYWTSSGTYDSIFHYMKNNPEKKTAPGIILELKVDHTPQEAIRQIKDKNYVLRFRGKLGEKPKYTGQVLAVGIGYNKKTKEHSCSIEILEGSM